MTSTTLVVRDEIKSDIDRAYDLVTLPEDKGHEERIAEIERLRRAGNYLLPVEREAHNVLVKQLEAERKEEALSAFPHPRLSLEPLTWRHPNGLPKLAVLDVRRADPFFVEAQRLDETVSRAMLVLPELIEAQYDDVVEMVASHCIRNRSKYRIEFSFKGVIPDSTRVKILQAQKGYLFDGIYMLVESPADAWTIHHTKGWTRRRNAIEKAKGFLDNLDPIVFGWAENTALVIDKFDLTDVESYVAGEFVQKALESGS